MTTRGAIDFDTLRIAIIRDGKPMTVSLAKVTYGELNAAIAQLADPAKKKPKSPLAKEVEGAVKRSGVKGVKVSVTRSQISLRVSLDGFKAVAREISDLDLPTG